MAFIKDFQLMWCLCFRFQFSQKSSWRMMSSTGIVQLSRYTAMVCVYKYTHDKYVYRLKKKKIPHVSSSSNGTSLGVHFAPGLTRTRKRVPHPLFAERRYSGLPYKAIFAS